MITFDELMAMDLKMLQEYFKALEIAEQYKMNRDRIKHLLSFDPVTVEKGRLLIAHNRTNILWHESSILIDAQYKSFNPLLTIIPTSLV